jgi:putative membrane protein
MVNQSRTFARQVLTYLPPRAGGRAPDGDADADVRAALAVGAAGAVIPSRLAVTALVGGAGSAPRRARGTDGAVRDSHGAALSPIGDEVLEAAETWETLEPCTFDAVSAEARELVYAQIGFVHAARCHLRRQDPFADIAPFFRPPVLAALRDEQNVPSAILVWMATRLRRAFVLPRAAPGGGAAASDGANGHGEGAAAVTSTMRLVALDETLSELTNLLGGCERIKNTPIPVQYDFLPRVMVRAYLTVLPLAVVAELGFATPFVTLVLGFLFLSLDTIGRNVEAPFENDIHDTPMTALCRTIEINLRQMLGERELPAPVQPVDGFLY